MTVRTEQGAWVVPPQEAMWIPAGIVHSVRMIGPVTTRSLYLRADAARMPMTCQVLAISGLMRELLLAAVELPVTYDEEGREGLIMSLALAELEKLHSLPLSLPFPTDAKLGRCCQKFLARPSAAEAIA